MKKKNIIFLGLAMMSISSCSDFLNVDSPSKFTDNDVVGSLDEAGRLLNGVYADIASSNTYGNAYLTTFNLNSDVEFTTSTNELKSTSHNEYKLFDCEADASNLLSTWNDAYGAVESANNFITAAQNSHLYQVGDSSMMQMIGEAKCLRAMSYLDLVIMFGDIPFSMQRAYDSKSLVMPIENRDTILTTLINDLKTIAPHMSCAYNLSSGVERCSKEFCWSLIARMALYRGGYSLRPGQSTTDAGIMKRPEDYLDYYRIARNYCDSVIKSGTHSLNNNYYDVFIKECNYKVVNSDDPIFEIPFTQNVSGNIGYIQGPKGNDSSAGGTSAPNLWGTSNGNVRLNAFYRFTFNNQDTRRNTVGYWYYDYDGTPVILNDYNNYCNKWSKFWDESHTLGYQSAGNTGINFPYMRYADVLLMFAEADNELNNGPTAAAKSALKTVRERAFRNATNKAMMVDTYVDGAGSKDSFFKLIFDERAWEFGGENLRWKDLVRWNLYSQVIYKTFWKYYGFGSRDYTYDIDDEYDKYPTDVFYKIVPNPGDGSYPNKVLPVLKFFKYESDTLTIDNLWENFGLNGKYMPSTTGSDAWKTAVWFDWLDNNTGIAKAQCRCSLRGYIYINDERTLMTKSIPEYSSSVNLNSLPPVRYILPIPSDAISRSNGTYKNYYGY
ncbi:RagB/SusD family nutrient uptake outer membrane protein [Xylanibacter oryzae]|uniref:RagB/SusD family nutrient uptake outer membrane protein n=1 Tax=Xylanibacter oryzae TaxID=185293 RepID=UPI0004B8D86F|nr:RagB/SusD family nutrient uptake outer membrane protein [Xylanibacter oryzae]